MASTDILTNWREVMCDAVRADGPDLSMRQWSILLTVYSRRGLCDGYFFDGVTSLSTKGCSTGTLETWYWKAKSVVFGER